MSPSKLAHGYLVFFETSGNQAYIYATNKLRENIGASELTYRAGTQWVLEAAGFSGVKTDKPREFRDHLRQNPIRSDGKAEIVLCTSGKAMLIVADLDEARRIVAEVTSRAVREAPGLAITGAIVPLKSRAKTDVDEAIQAAHKRFNANRDLMPTPAQRFAMLPFCEPCATTGLPASVVGKDGAPYSAMAEVKRQASGAWFERIRSLFREGQEGLFIARSPDDLETKFEDLDWVGVVYSDGNGLGQIMMRFTDWLTEGQDYLETLRTFSLELDAATEDAFCTASKTLAELRAVREAEQSARHQAPRQLLPLVPLLLGGDDLTVMVDGRYALPFAKSYLLAFEAETGKQPTISAIARQALGAGRLSAGAGVAIVKKHFPYHSAHEMAEELLKSAKRTKQSVVHAERQTPFPCSSLDFHILLDAAFSSLGVIRDKRRTAPKGERLWGGPYVVTPLDDVKGASEASRQWAETHHINELERRVQALMATDDDGRYRLPSSQMHMLREAVAQGKAVADARLQELARLKDQGLEELIEDKEGEGSLFAVRDDVTKTRFVDALSSMEFWGFSAATTTARVAHEEAQA